MQRDASLTGPLQVTLDRQTPAKDPARKECDAISIPLKLGWHPQRVRCCLPLFEKDRTTSGLLEPRKFLPDARVWTNIF